MADGQEGFKASEFKLDRSDVAEAFHCARCQTDKKAKNKATGTAPDGTWVKICNGCYGNIKAREESGRG